MPNKKGTRELNQLIEKAIKEKNLSKENVKNYFEKVFGGTAKSGHFSAFLAGKKTAEISFLIGVYAALQGGSFPKKSGLTASELQKSFVKTNPNDLKKWLVHWLEGILEQDLQRKRRIPITIEDSYLGKWVKAIEELKAHFEEARTCKSELPTLEYFPDAFTPLTVITGTGLAIPPVRISDLFRDNTRLTDLFFLNELNLPKETRIVSDRLVIDMSRDERIKHFGRRHLLLIGGPKVNAVTRKFCKYGFFRFKFRDKEKNFQDFYDSLNNEEVRKTVFPNEYCVKMLYELLENPGRSYDDDDESFKETVKDKRIRKNIYDKSLEIREKLGNPENFTYGDIVKIFLPTDLVDPVSNSCHSIKAGDGKENTLITIAPNFYNRDTHTEASFESYKYKFVSVIVAGIDKLGTASGIKKLSQPEDFTTHPIGGFLEAVGGSSALDFDRYNESDCSWTKSLTPPYTIEDFIKKINDFDATDESKNKDSALQRIAEEQELDEKGLVNYLKFLKMFQTRN